jgi:membrane-bound ClpP family serine protease
MGFIITLILVGLVLMFAEILLVPGVGVAGILGLISMGGSCFCAFHQYGNTVGAIVTAVNVVLLVALMIWVLRAKTWKRVSLKTNIDSKAVTLEVPVAVGDKGVTATRLAPMGNARFGYKSIEVTAFEGMINPGTEIEVVAVEGMKVFVKPSDVK